MRRSRLLHPSEIAAILLFAVAGILMLAGRHLYGNLAQAALYAQVRALPGHVDPVVLAGMLVAAIVLGGFVLHRIREAFPIIYGSGAITVAGVGGAMLVMSLARPVLHEPDNAIVDVTMLAACAGLCAAVLVAVRGWETLLHGCARRRHDQVLVQPTSGGRPLSGLLTPASMARTAAQLALQLANYAAAEADRRQADAARTSAQATAHAGTAARDVEEARIDAQDWAAARLAQANAHVAVRKAGQG